MPVYKPRYKRYARKKTKKTFVRKTKKLVTGQGPTLLEKIAGYAGPVSTVARAVLPVISAINTEAKYLDTPGAVTTATLAAPYIVNLTSMSQGLTDNNRIGNSVLLRDVAINIRLIQIPTATSKFKNFAIRFLMFVDKMQNGSPPSLGNIMENTASILSKTNKDFTDRYVILHDKVYTMTPTNENSEYRVDDKFYNKLEFHARYLGPSAGSGDQGPNAVYVMYWPDNVTSGDVNVGGYARLNFTDN